MSYKDCIGEVKFNHKGTPMKVLFKYEYPYVEIEFQDEKKYTTKVHYQNFKNGTVLNPYDKTIFGIGCLGVGKYRTKVNNHKTLEYNIWMSILQRCYVEKYRYKYPAYEDCFVCDEWLNFQCFAQWFNENYYDVGDGKRMHIDKDILGKGNKVYSPETCIFVPQRINMIFMKKSRITDSDLPTGVRRSVTGFMAEYNTKYLGNFKTLEEAVNIYNIEKQLHINEVAEEYKDRIPEKLYNALINYSIDLKVA